MSLSELIPKKTKTQLKKVVCPMCNLVLTNESANAAARHVNMCMDLRTSTPSSTKTKHSSTSLSLNLTNESATRSCPACGDVMDDFPGSLDKHLPHCSFGQSSSSNSSNYTPAKRPYSAISLVSKAKVKPMMTSPSGEIDQQQVKAKFQSLFSRPKVTPKPTKRANSVGPVHKKMKANPVVSRVNTHPQQNTPQQSNTMSPASTSNSSNTAVSLNNNNSGISSFVERKAVTHGRQGCPSHKYIPSTRLMVDAFQYAPVKPNSIYFLTHYHSDHYVGLSKSWDLGTIYCSGITAQLLKNEMSLSGPRVQVVPMNTRVLLENHVYVTLIDANHCPGAVILFIELPNDPLSLYIHVGDFRYHSVVKRSALAIPHIAQLLNTVPSTVYLDTTYGKPPYVFPEQKEILQYVIHTVNKILLKEHTVSARQRTEQKKTGLSALLNGYDAIKKPKTLFLVGTYYIGKEKLLMAIIRYCQLKVFITNHKMRAYRAMDLMNMPNTVTDGIALEEVAALEHTLTRNPKTRIPSTKQYNVKPPKKSIAGYFATANNDKKNMHTIPLKFADVFTTNMNEARVHVRSLQDISIAAISENLNNPQHYFTTLLKSNGFNNIVAFKPTGWVQQCTVNTKMIGTVNVAIHSVPYSEHSCFKELCEFINWVKPKDIVDTVTPFDHSVVQQLREHASRTE